MSGKAIPRNVLTQDHLKWVLRYDPDTGEFTWTDACLSKGKAGKRAGRLSDIGYWMIRVGGKEHLAHRLAWLWMNGEFPKAHIDHDNRVRSDNRWANLRLATREQNGANRGVGKNNTSGFKGVNFVKERGKWRSRIFVNRREKHLGYFDSSDEAVAAYADAARKYHREFSCAPSGYRWSPANLAAMTAPLPFFDVTVPDLPPKVYQAKTRFGAMSMAYRDYSEVLGRIGFRDFLRIARARRRADPQPAHQEAHHVG